MHPGINCCPEPPESCRALLAVPSSAGVAAPTQLALNQCPRSRGWGGASQPLSSPHGLTPPSPGAAAPPASAALTEVLRDVQVVPEAQAGVGGSREGLALQPGTGAPQAQHTGVKVHVVTWKGRDRAWGVPWFRSPPPASCHPPANGQGDARRTVAPPALLLAAFGAVPGEEGTGMLRSRPPRTYWGCSRVSPPLPSFACSLRPCQGARGGGVRTVPRAQGVILLRAGVPGQGGRAPPAPGEAAQAGVRGAAPAARVPLEVAGRWEERGGCDVPSTAGTHCPALPEGGQGIQSGGSRRHPPPQHPQLGARPSSGQEQGAWWAQQSHEGWAGLSPSPRLCAPIGCPVPTPLGARRPRGVGSHLARGRVHLTRAGHPARCTRGHLRLPPPRISPAGGVGRVAHWGWQLPGPPVQHHEVPRTLPCLTCQSPSGWMVTWPRCQAFPSMVLIPITFLRTPLCFTKTPREPAQGTHH